MGGWGGEGRWGGGGEGGMGMGVGGERTRGEREGGRGGGDGWVVVVVVAAVMVHLRKTRTACFLSKTHTRETEDVFSPASNTVKRKATREPRGRDEAFLPLDG